MDLPKNVKRHLFMHYSYLLNLGTMFNDLMPPVIRTGVFKLILKRCGRNVFIDYGVYFRFPGKIEIGDEVTIGRYCAFYPSFFQKTSTIRIQDNVRIGPSVTFLAAGHDHRFMHLPDTGGSILIEKNVWIGANVTILSDISIGEGAVIAAGSLVNIDIQPYTVVAGVPARNVKQREILTEGVIP